MSITHCTSIVYSNFSTLIVFPSDSTEEDTILYPLDEAINDHTIMEIISPNADGTYDCILGEIFRDDCRTCYCGANRFVVCTDMECATVNLADFVDRTTTTDGKFLAHQSTSKVAIFCVELSLKINGFRRDLILPIYWGRLFRARFRKK